MYLDNCRRKNKCSRKHANYSEKAIAQKFCGTTGQYVSNINSKNKFKILLSVIRQSNFDLEVKVKQKSSNSIHLEKHFLFIVNS